MIYGYKCPVCKQTFIAKERTDRLSRLCTECGHSPLHRDFSGIAVERPMQEHWNATVNKPISSMRQFDAELRRKSDEMSHYTQVDQRLERLDPDAAMKGVTDSGLESTNDDRIRRGVKSIDLDKLHN